MNSDVLNLKDYYDLKKASNFNVEIAYSTFAGKVKKLIESSESNLPLQRMGQMYLIDVKNEKDFEYLLKNERKASGDDVT
jgi:hypothetical protein